MEINAHTSQHRTQQVVRSAVRRIGSENPKLGTSSCKTTSSTDKFNSQNQFWTS
jgi:hypothetical protein